MNTSFKKLAIVYILLCSTFIWHTATSQPTLTSNAHASQRAQQLRLLEKVIYYAKAQNIDTKKFKLFYEQYKKNTPIKPALACNALSIIAAVLPTIYPVAYQPYHKYLVIDTIKKAARKINKPHNKAPRQTTCICAQLTGRIKATQIGTKGVTARGAKSKTKIANSSVTTAKIADSAVVTNKLAHNAVTTAKLATNTITSAKIVDEAITSTKIIDGAVITNKLANGAVTTTKLATDAVTSTKIVDESITSAKLVDGAVVTDKLAHNAVTTAKLATNAITSTKIVDESITSAKLVDGAVVTDKLAHNAVTTAKLATNAVTSTKIVDESITSAKLAGSIPDSKLAVITAAGKVANSATTATPDNTANTIVARDALGNFAANTITTGKITGLTTPLTSTDATNKAYVDAATHVLQIKNSVAAIENVSNITTREGLLTIDGYTLIAGDRVLLNHQIDARQNGIWQVNTTSPYTWARPSDFLDGNSAAFAYIIVTNGDTYYLTGWVCSNCAPFIVGTSSLAFSQLSGLAREYMHNIGDGTGEIYKQKDQAMFKMRTLKPGSNMTIVTDCDVVTINTADSLTIPNDVSIVGNLTLNKSTNHPGFIKTDNAGLVSAQEIISTADIADNAIGSNQLASNAITTAKINDLAITTEKLAAGAVTDAKIDSVASSKITGIIANSQTTATSDNAPNAIVTRDSAGNFAATTIATNSVSTNDVSIAGNLTLSKFINHPGFIKTDSVGAISAQETITTADIADNAIGSNQLASNAITTAKINDLAITTEKLAAGAVTDAKIDSVASSKITGIIANSQTTATSDNTPNTIIARDSAGNFAATTIATNSVSTNDVSIAGNLTLSKSTNHPGFIKTDSVGAISAQETITTADIADNAIGSNQLASNAITTAKINDLAITTEKLAAGAVTDAKIDSVASSKITGIIANSQTTATSDNTPNTIIARDSAGNFAATTIATNSVSTNDVSIAGNLTLSKFINHPGFIKTDSQGLTSAQETITAVDIADNAIGSNQLASNAITTAKINDLAITTEKLEAGAVTDAKIDSVASSKITGIIANSQTTATSDNTPNTIITRDSSGTFAATTIATNSVSTNDVSIAGNLTLSKSTNHPGFIKTDSVGATSAQETITTVDIADNAIGSNQLASNAITTAKINDLAITTEKLAAGAVTDAKIDNVASSKIIGIIANNQTTATSDNTPNAIVTRDSAGNFAATTIATNSVSTNDVSIAGNLALSKFINHPGFIKTDSVGATSAQETITTVDIADNAIGSNQLASNAVTTAKINDLAITTEKLAAGAVTDAKIDSVASSKIIGIIANSQTTATSDNTPNTIITRDSASNFAAGTITANTVTGLSAPNNGTDAANKEYVDTVSTYAVQNVGSGADVYKDAAENVFSLRKLNSDNANLVITQKTDDITFSPNTNPTLTGATVHGAAAINTLTSDTADTTIGLSGYNKVGIGGAADTSAMLKVTGNTTITGTLTVGGSLFIPIPTGTIFPYAATIAPAGFLLCDGSYYSTTGTYANLYAIIGYTYGGSDGTFRVPNLPGMFPVCLGASPFDTLGNTGGAQTVTLTTAQLPAHIHTITDPGHTHTITQTAHTHALTDPGHMHTVCLTKSTANDTAIPRGGKIATETKEVTTNKSATGITLAPANALISNNNASTGIATNPSGDGKAVSILPPYLTINYIIKY